MNDRYATFVWYQATCDWCGGKGVRTLVPLDPDGNLEAREFPCLCAVCHGDERVRATIETKWLDERRGPVDAT